MPEWTRNIYIFTSPSEEKARRINEMKRQTPSSRGIYLTTCVHVSCLSVPGDNLVALETQLDVEKDCIIIFGSPRDQTK